MPLGNARKNCRRFDDASHDAREAEEAAQLLEKSVSAAAATKEEVAGKLVEADTMLATAREFCDRLRRASDPATHAGS